MEHGSVSTPTKLDDVALCQELRKLRTLIPDSPWLNPIQAVAFDLSRRLEAGEFELDDLRDMVTRLLDRACVTRASSLKARVGFQSSAKTHADFASYVTTTASDSAQSQPDFASFKARWERARSGVVLTAHPTFGSSRELYRRMVEIAVGPEATSGTPLSIPHRPNDPIDLQYEHDRTQETLSNLRDALQDLYGTFLAAGHDTFGDEVFDIRPRLCTLASWVGYDLDGRTDITWTKSLHLRLSEKLAALEDIRRRFLALNDKLETSKPDVQRLSRQIVGKLDLGIAAAGDQLGALAKVIENDGEGLADAANVITRADGYNLTTVKPITAILDELVAVLDDKDARIAVAALRALIETNGLGTSHIHLRINAAQLSNALRAFVQDAWVSNLGDRTSIVRLAQMIRDVRPETVNFKTLDLETATAIRQLALVSQLKKHIDSESPIRFLIAESESPATVMIALFFARLFGVDDIVDISPLFETPSGLERGARIMEELLQEEVYRNYVKQRGRLAIQTGFSDAGRFVGQIAATLAIERMHRTLAGHMEAAGVEGVETLIFSTHGESMGRGAHPGDLTKRLRYVLSPQARRAFARRDLPVKHETSFQGGDGFLFFGSRDLTAAALSSIIKDAETPEDDGDPFYDDEDLTLDFYLRLRAYQQELFSQPGYRALLGAYGPNLLFKTGSRAVKRQSDAATPADRGDPSRMRAIPNNAILQQFGYVANVVAGLGDAAGYDRDRIIGLANSSPRLRLLFEMVARGKQLSSLNAMGANAAVFDAGFWAWRASWGREANLEPAFRTLSTTLLSDTRTAEINSLIHHLRIDAIDLHAILEAFHLEGGKVPDDLRLEVDLLQAVRAGLIQRIFILAARLPRFAPRNDMTYEQLLDKALAFDIPDVLAFMRKTFPHQAASEADVNAFTEKASYRPHGIDDYARLEGEILKPMEEAYELIREIGTGISHHFGAFG